MSFPQEIKAAREKRGLTQFAAARLCAVPRQTWNDWERGARTPNHFTRQAVLSLLAKTELDAAGNSMPLSHTNDTERAQNPGDIRSPEDSR